MVMRSKLKRRPVERKRESGREASGRQISSPLPAISGLLTWLDLLAYRKQIAFYRFCCCLDWNRFPSAVCLVCLVRV